MKGRSKGVLRKYGEVTEEYEGAPKHHNVSQYLPTYAGQGFQATARCRFSNKAPIYKKGEDPKRKELY